MQQSFDITTIIFAALAIFVLFKLRSVLGTKTGNEKPPTDPFSRPQTPPPAASNESATVIRLPGAAQVAAEPVAPPPSSADFYKGLADEGAFTGLDAIRAADPAFDARAFLDGAKSAYEMIVTAFAAGNSNMLRDLLSKEVFDSFAAEIDARQQRGETVEMTFVSIDRARITEAQLRGGTAQISIDFLSKLITATRDRSGTVIDGSAEKVVDVTDLWTFAREVRARDPNWKLVATGASH